MSAADYVGSVCNGFVKSFHMKNGWGFLKSADFSEDVFVSYNTARDFAIEASMLSELEGHACTFKVERSKTNPGTFEATEVRLKFSHESAVTATKAQGKGNNMTNWAVKGYGMTDWAVKGNGMTDWAGKGKGMIDWAVKGKGKNCFAGKDHGKTACAKGPGAQIGKRCPGVFKSFNVKRGWGFLSSNLINDDIFVSFTTAPELKLVLEMVGDLAGQPVTFRPAESISHPGQFEAKDVMLDNIQYEGEQEGEQEIDSAAGEGQLVEGTFKSFHTKKGWGFLQSPSVDGDVFVSFITAPELKDIVNQAGRLEGLPASFLLQPSKSTPGSYEATSVTLLQDDYMMSDLGQGGKQTYFGKGASKGKHTRSGPY